MWVIPVDLKENSPFSLKPYKQSGYLICMQSKGGIKAVVREGRSDEIDSDGTFRLHEISS